MITKLTEAPRGDRLSKLFLAHCTMALLQQQQFRGMYVSVADAFRVGSKNSTQMVTTFSSPAPEEGQVWTHEGGAMVAKHSYEIGPAGGLKFLGGLEIVGTVDEFGPNNLNQSWQVYDIEMDGTIHADWRDTLTRMDQTYTIIASGGDKTFTVPEIMPGCMVLVNTSNPGTTFTFPNAAAFAAEFGTQLRTGASWILELANNTANDITLADNTGVVVAPTTLAARENLKLVIRRLGASSWEVFAMQSSLITETAPGNTIVAGTPDTYAANANSADQATLALEANAINASVVASGALNAYPTPTVVNGRLFALQIPAKTATEDEVDVFMITNSSYVNTGTPIFMSLRGTVGATSGNSVHVTVGYTGSSDSTFIVYIKYHVANDYDQLVVDCFIPN